MPDRDAQATRPALARLHAARYPLAAALAVLAALAAFGEASAVAALLGGAAILAVAALAPRRGPRQTEAPPEPPRPALPLAALDLAEALEEPLILFDSDGTIVHANRAAREAFDIAGEGSPVLLRFRSREMQELVGGLLAGVPGGATIEHLERTPVERWFRVSARTLPAAAGLHLLAFREQSEARRIDRMRADFIANASHELRTPLASVAGFIDTLRGPARDDTAARERFLAIMHDQTARMARLIDDLLSLSRLEMKAPLRPSGSVGLRGVLGGVADALQPLAAELGVVIERPADGPEIAVSGDRDELIQVFENLVENACKYGQSGGRVEIGLTVNPDGEPEVSVRDHGPGIPEEHIPRITERFYRVDVATSRARKGTGLGLSIVKHILTRHHARLAISSAPGEGSTFRVTFPADEKNGAG